MKITITSINKINQKFFWGISTEQHIRTYQQLKILWEIPVYSSTIIAKLIDKKNIIMLTLSQPKFYYAATVKQFSNSFKNQHKIDKLFSESTIVLTTWCKLVLKWMTRMED